MNVVIADGRLSVTHERVGTLTATVGVRPGRILDYLSSTASANLQYLAEGGEMVFLDRELWTFKAANPNDPVGSRIKWLEAAKP